jgi:hypothetical protein
MLANRPAAFAYAAALILTAAVAVLLFRVPLPYLDNTLLGLPLEPSAATLFLDTMNQAGFMRPASRATSKLVFDASAGHEFVAFRTLHVVMFLALLLGTVRLLRVRSPLECGLAVLAMAVILGMHPVHEAARETDLNIKLLIPALCTVATVLAAAGRRTWWRDAAALALLLYAVMANELGLLVWVCLAAAFLVGFRGVSGRAVATGTLFVALYLALRFAVFDVGAPALTERGSGFGLRTYEPPELVAMFGDNPFPYYAYNIGAAAASVLFSEPRAGVFVLVREIRNGTLESGTVLNVVTSMLSTAMLAWYAWRRRQAWRTRQLTHHDRLFLVAAASVAANAVISYPYLKDVTMSGGAVFYPLALVAALHLLISEQGGRAVPLGRAALVTGVIGAVSVGWTIRASAFAIDMRQEAVKVQRDWGRIYDVLAEDDLGREKIDLPFVERFRAQMLAMPVPDADRDPDWITNLDPH